MGIMTMTDALLLLLCVPAGGALGAVFFGGLWWTVRRGLASGHPALWFMASLMLRLAITLSGFYLVGGGQWQRLILCLLGFIAARLVVERLTRASGQGAGGSATEAGNAP
jgi:F1F0 ATPase subunit 2